MGFEGLLGINRGDMLKLADWGPSKQKVLIILEISQWCGAVQWCLLPYVLSPSSLIIV